MVEKNGVEYALQTVINPTGLIDKFGRKSRRCAIGDVRRDFADVIGKIELVAYY